MPQVFSLVVLALAVSLDGFGVGAMYGLRRIRIPFSSICIISLFSGCMIYASMQIGVLLSRLFSPHIASLLGAIILIGIGIWTIYQSIAQNRKKTTGAPHKQVDSAEKLVGVSANQTIFRIKFRHFSLVVQILRTPSVADVDHSGIISASEAALLGFALSLDAFGAGIGAALIGLKPLLTAAASVVSCGTFVSAGLKTGNLLAEWKWVQRLTFLPGLILIAMGMMKLLNS